MILRSGRERRDAGVAEEEGGGGDPLTDLLFTSDWDGTTIGSFAMADILDQAKSVPWPAHTGNTVDDLGDESVSLSIRDGTALGFPTSRCLRVDAVHGSEIGEPTELQQYATGFLTFGAANTAWAAPSVGGSLYYRLYKRFVWPVGATEPDVNLGSANHCVEETTQVARNWHWTFNSSASGWQPSFNANDPVTRHILGGAANTFLPRDTVYRLEWRVHRTASDECQFEVRIYNAADELIHDTDDFATSGGVALSGATFNYVTGSVPYYQIGTNGLGFGSQPTGSVRPAWYFAGAAIRGAGWCGPYIAGESVAA